MVDTLELVTELLEATIADNPAARLFCRDALLRARAEIHKAKGQASRAETIGYCEFCGASPGCGVCQ